MSKPFQRRLVLALAICAAVGAAAAGYILRMHSLPEHQPGATQLQEHSPEISAASGPMEQRVEAGQLADAIADATQSRLAISDLAVEIHDDCTISLSGSVPRQELTQLAQESGDDAGLTGSLLALLPEQIPLQLTVAASAKDNALHLEAQELSVASVHVPEGFLDDSLLDAAAKAMTQQLCGDMSQIQSVTADGGALLISGFSS